MKIKLSHIVNKLFNIILVIDFIYLCSILDFAPKQLAMGK